MCKKHLWKSDILSTDAGHRRASLEEPEGLKVRMSRVTNLSHNNTSVNMGDCCCFQTEVIRKYCTKRNIIDID